MTHLTQAEFARLRGVNKSTVTRWIQNGRMAPEPNGLIDPDRAAAQLADSESPMPHHQARKAQFDEARKGAGQGAQEKTQQAPSCATEAATAATREGEPADEELGAALKRETYKLQKAKAETANMELDKLAGALVERAEVDYVLADFGNTLRGLMDTLPTRLHMLHQGDSQKIAEIEGVAGDLLHEMADHMKRKMEEA